MITNTIRAQYGGTPQSSIEIDNHEENEAHGWILVTHKKRRHQAVLKIRLPKIRATRSNVNQLQSSKNVMPCTSQKIIGSLSQKVQRPITLDEFFLEKFFCGSHIGATHVVSSTYETKESKGKHNTTITQEHQANEKMCKNSTEEVSIKLSPSKGDMQTNIDNEQPIFCYILRECRKKRQPLLKECTQQVHPPRKEFSHITFQDLKEKMIVLVAQVSSITLEPSKGNTQVGKIKRNFDQKVFTLFEKSGYTFSNPVKLVELRDEVTGKTPRRTSVFERIGRLTPSVSTFEILGLKDEKESFKQVDIYATILKTSVFHRLGTKRKSSLERRLLEHENQDFYDVTDDKEIHSVFPSRMKRKAIFSITTDGLLKVKRSTIIDTNQFHRETKEEDEAITVFVGSQKKDSNLMQSSYHITTKEDEQRRRVKQDIVANFKGVFVRIRKNFDHDFYIYFSSWRLLRNVKMARDSYLFEGVVNEVLPENRLETTKYFPTFPEINNFSRRSTSSNNLRSTLLKALESWRSLGEKNQENNRIILTTIHQ
ncbi:hypothetical protein H5410_027996 [Solanum commersonii]|uniref:Uncharacterized protein n=1 Tax=Solanum commersonii TaxID=4109 RepID=A0A9J5Z3I6_SOLCO|nr:hypothetical protein H5410_027996 [Solanum commersonii]